MIITDRLLFLQLQKTACTHIETLLKELFAGQEQFGKHRRMPRDFDPGTRLTVGSIRNPWDWYVSLWAFGCSGKGGPYRRSARGRSIRNVLFDPRVKRLVGRRPVRAWVECAFCELGRSAASWKALQSDHGDPGQFREWLKLVLDSKRRFDLFQDYGYSRISAYAGLLTYLYEVLYLRDTRLLHERSALPVLDALRLHDRECNVLAATIRTEHLEDDLIDALVRAGYELGEDQTSRIRSAERTNASRRESSLEYYYDAECIDLVAEKESLIVGKYAYRKPGQALPGAAAEMPFSGATARRV